jgi:hypothetical protein
MKKRLHTSFIKFIVEKYDKEIQELPEEETNSNNEMDEFDKIMGYGDGDEQDDEIQDEQETLENDDESDDSIDDLIKEYRKLQGNLLEKKYKIKTNGSIRNKRK